MDTLPASLTQHQRGPNRRPAFLLSLQNRTFQRPRFNWTRLYDGAEPNSPVDAVATATGALVTARNDSGTIRARHVADPQNATPSQWADWFTVASGTPGTGVALATTPNGDVVLCYVTNSGQTLRQAVSTNDGASFPSDSSILTEGSPISWIALGVTPATNNIVLFYVMAGTSTVKAVRRTSGSWGSAATWPHSGEFDQVTGIAAHQLSADQHIVVTGTTDTLERKIAAGLFFGDGLFPPGFWGGLNAFLDLDPESTVDLNAPSLAPVGSDAFVTLGWHETGDAPDARAYFTHPPGSGVTVPGFLQPYPTEAENSHGAALTVDHPHAYLATPSGTWHANTSGAVLLQDQLIAADWRYTEHATRAAFTIDDPEPAASGQQLEASPGMDLYFTAGYSSGTDGALEAGEIRRFRVERVTRSFARDGRRTLTLSCNGPWEALDNWRSPIAHQFPAGEMTRQELFTYFTGRAGVPTSGSGAAGWATHQPGFALNPGESARAAAMRLLTPTETVVRHEAGILEAIAPPSSSEYTYGPGEHPIAEAHEVQEAPATNWLRLQAEERYADAHHFAALNAHGPRFAVVRQLHATNNTLAVEYADAALERISRTTPALKLTVPYNAGQRLSDIVTVQVPELGIDDVFRVVAIENHYARGPRAPRYDSVLTLASLAGG